MGIEIVHHPAIIDRRDWDAAQQRLEERRKKSYPFTSLLRCAYCGASLIRVVAEKKWVSWKCATYLHQGKAACVGMQVPDHIVQAYHERTPITGHMVVKEAENAKRTRTRTDEDYRFVPIDPENGEGQ